MLSLLRHAPRSSATMSTIAAKPFKLALVQLAGLGKDKTRNLEIASQGVTRAVQEGKADVVVLPEIFNSPYAVTAFRQYAEPIPSVFPSKASELAQQVSQAESVAALSRMAQTHGVWLIGGSIPEIEQSEDKIYNTCTVYNPQGKAPPYFSPPHPSCLMASPPAPTGDLVAKHRKVHLFDIDIPGKQYFKESETLTGGTQLTTFSTPFGKIGLGICYDITRATKPGEVLAEADEHEAIVYADIDPEFLAATRRGLPVTVQRRFDVYPDISKA
ncbi:hypothetical protein QFC19_003921 [Naganishia cerealis]|uniref:Uncharacterized protein n=1 Tax=Naganishia cerealis TaxID=610337 RepID=A0ACC2W0D3_9TREE|nr:hypothetical protein QFC19_003921 [Naganishia cerealis]